MTDMRDYGKVHTSFWTSRDILDLSDDAKLLALYLLSSPHSTIIGCFRLPDGYLSEDLGWSSFRATKALHELFEKGFANRCETTKWVWVYRFLKWNLPENPNQWKAAQKIAATIPAECVWKPAFMRVFAELRAPDPAARAKAFATVPQPFRNQKQEQEQEQESIPSQGGDIGEEFFGGLGGVE